MKRDMIKQLKEWKITSHKKPLIIKGARQVGKTFVIREFARECYKEIVEVNFERDLEYIKLFQSTRNPAFRLSQKNIGYHNDIMCIPLYLLEFVLKNDDFGQGDN